MPKTKTEKVPPGLAKAVAKVAKKIDGRYCYALPHYSLDTKLRVDLVELGDLSLFEENEVDRDEIGAWVPFAALKSEPQFLAISTQAPYAVGMWEHEDGKIHDTWDSLEDFVAKLIDKKDKTPFEKLEKQLEKIQKLVEDDEYADALGILEPVMKTLPKLPEGRASFEDGGISTAFNLYGLALKGVKKLPQARAAFEVAVEAGDNYAILNILGMLENGDDPRGVIDYALKARAVHYFDDYCRIWIARYLGAAYAAVGDLATAEAELRKSVDDYGVSAADKLTEARDSLEEYISEGHPGADAAKPFLGWYKPKTYEVTPAQAKANKALWKSFPDGMRAKLMEEIDKEDAEPTDEDIARCFDVDSLDLDEEDGTFDKLDAFLHFPLLERLSFYGDPDDVEPLRALAKLKRLTINNDVIKDFKLPSRADRDLLAAAEKADKKGMEKALAAGANVAARDDFGATALFRVAGTHDIKLCTWLIEKGADPWAGNHSEMTAMSMFDDEGRQKLEAAAAKAGIAHPDNDPYRALERAHGQRAATFSSELDLELEDGEALAGKWPAGAKFKMESPKKDNKLYDLHRVKYRGFVASERLAEVLRGPNVELHPVTLVDHAGKKRPEKYFFVNPLAIDCLVLDKCYPQWNHIDPESISGLPAYVIDPAKVGGAQMFRLERDNSHPVIITRELAKKIEGFTGVSIDYCKR
jgi:uncharacterized protein DUF1629